MRASCLVVLFLWLPGSVQATVYYSGEKYQQLPSSWPGFLMDHRALRMVGISLSPKTPPSLLRQEYQSHYERLIGRRALLNADELADLGALALRLGKTDQALDVLRPAARQYPKHFTLQANLASAWHMAGQWQEAFEQQQLVLGLAPVESQAVERLHLKLMHGRRTSGTALDDLFGVHYSKDNGHRLGRLTAEEQKKLPVDAVAMTQRLALSFPLDARLLWQLGELAAIHGDPATAGQLMDQCVGELGWSDPTLRLARSALLQSIDPKLLPSQQQVQHAGHATGLKLTMRSKRPLVQQPFDVNRLAAQKPGEPSLLAWPLLAETAVEQSPQRLRFHPYLEKLEGQLVMLTGFLHPLTDDLDCTSFLLVENPIGCWYCTAPDLTGLVFVTMKPGTTARFTRDVITVAGSLKLNRSDPEEFLVNVVQAKVQTVK
ncbi:MAG: tetratricopeptide repeat protein [Gemmatales bacterium]